MQTQMEYKFTAHTDDDLTFAANLTNDTKRVVYVKLRAGELWLQIDEDRQNIMSPFMDIKDLSVLSEEEFFQESLIWDYTLPIELVRVVQSHGIEKIRTFTKYDETKVGPHFYDTSNWIHTVEY